MAKTKSPKTSIDVEHVAKLANLTLTPTEKNQFQKQLEEILNYISKLNNLDTKDTKPIGQVTGLVNVGRDDLPGPSLTQEQALQNTKKVHNGLFEVDAILDQ